MEAALNKLFKITVFIIKKHEVHITSFKDLAHFIEDLKEEVLNNYLNLANKDATYVSASTVSLFVKEISDWM